jgi:phage terminase large subunit GpA-like protein
MTKATLSKTDRLNAVISKALQSLRPPEDLTVSEWADKYRMLSSESSAEPGPWSTSRTPYLKEVMDSFSDINVRHIVMVSASQVGKSELENNIIGYIIEQDPGSILFIQPTVTDAKEYSKLRIAPMLRDTPVLAKRIGPQKSRDSGNTILQKTYPGGILTLTGSTEAHALASKPIRYVIGDEIDRWATNAGNEGDPWELAMARQITFYNAKSIEVSTPTIKGNSAIEKAFYKGTMERWCVACPACGEYHNIVFADIRYAYDTIVTNNNKTFRVREVYYVCPNCGAVSYEKEMKRQPAKWIAENPEAYKNGTRSFWLNTFVSPWQSWDKIILKFLEARGSTTQLQVVYNTQFGELWEDRGGLEDEDTYMARREEYTAELPDGVLVLTCGVDTQDDRLEYEVVGHGLHNETWGIRRGQLMGRPDDPATWTALDDILDHVYRYGDGKGIKISMTLVDTGGHFATDVRLNCQRRISKKVFACMGLPGDRPYTAPPKKLQIVTKGKQYLGTCWIYQIGVDAGKQNIMDNLRVQQTGSRYCHFPINEDRGYGHAFFWGLLSEHLVYKEGHRQKWQWDIIPGHERNEPLDCRNYANAAFKILAPDMDAVLRRLKGRMPGAESAPPPKPAKKKPRPSFDRFYDEW